MRNQFFLICSLFLSIATQGVNINFTTPTINQPMIINNLIQNGFSYNTSRFDCSLTYLFTYNQTIYELNQNQPNIISVSGLTQNAIFSLRTKYNNIQPTLSQSSCSPTNCALSITNNCKTDVTYQNYFDIFQILIITGNYTATVSYNLYCLDSYTNDIIEVGLIVLIIIITIGIAISAFFSKAWSLQGMGIKITIELIILFNILIVIGGIIAFFSQTGIEICLIILSYFLGIIGVAITTNQFLFLLRLKFLNIRIIKIKSFQFRIMELLSIITGVALTVGWWYSNRNIFLNDILCICIIISCIKILKFTSLRLAGLAFLITIILQLIAVLLLYFLSGQNYNNLFINTYNYPIQLQIPTINPVYNQICAWLPFTSIAFPGMLLSYLRRFDTSRNTYVYILASTALFSIGATAWFFTTLSPLNLPFGLISQPCMFGLVCIFAYRRRQIRVLWRGQFYDQQFANQGDLQSALQMMVVDKGRRQTIDKKLIEQLKQFNDKESRNRSQINNDVVRSKFLR